MTAFSLAHLTAIVLPPPELVRVAARTGYDTVGLRLVRVTDTSPGYPLMDDPGLLRATKAAMADTGVGVLDVEFLRFQPETDVRAWEPVLAAGAELGARYAICAPYDPDLARMTDRFGALCDLAAGYGLGCVMEFFPWTVLPGLAEAAALVARAGRANGHVLLDTLHFDRSGSTLAQLDAVPRERLPFLHLCDAPAGANWTTEQLLHAGRAERLPPGEGGIDLRAILARMPPGIPIALEVPMTALLTAEGAEAVARRVRLAAGRLLDGGNGASADLY